MEAVATQKFIRMSPTKLRPVVAMIKGMTPARAVEVLPFIGRRAAEPLLKVIKTAIANAVQKGSGTEELRFKEIQIGEGPRLKRGNPVSRGRFHPIKKRMSHIRVALISASKEVKATKKEEKQTEAVEVKKEVKKQVKKAAVKKTAKKGSK